MNLNMMLFISPIQIFAFLIILLLLIVLSLILASKEEKSFHFLIWSAIIIFLPFVGSLSYLLKYYSSKQKLA